MTNYNTAAIDAYVNVDWDEYHVGKTLVRPKTTEPRWNEEFIANDVHSGRAIGFTIFHNCVMPPDDFVANTRIPFDDLKIGSCNDIWVDLEPHGQLHVVIELHGSAVEVLFYVVANIYLKCTMEILRVPGQTVAYRIPPPQLIFTRADETIIIATIKECLKEN
ncbi:C2 domain protein [Necator americanus]|uniref:C2 domain protein n=1 Tax=Necator americanus TaxID=51031 RepID=W2T5Q4_NECAM|nr:C2 domain protein [Necator americanus]ETN77340.1 C2 domain protein [Necator americanus]